MEATTDQLVPDTSTLVLRARQRDAGAFAALIRRYERVALSVAFSVLGNADSAGDVVQDAFLRAWERLGDLKEPARFATWLCGIARNLAIDIKRRNRHLTLTSDAQVLDAGAMAADRFAPDPADELDLKEQRAQVAAALQSLDDVTRPAVILRYYDGLSSKQIAEILEMSPAAVDMRLSRARQQLKALLEQGAIRDKAVKA
ncbi:MAG TPA: sigma-70 family RNA polymerase sigma factor [Tepidisphaeraceae bacterium]|jgi:RNA polymerase sigma factor (sigma-70 family)|nr:sigma-70 family RNA polymerase sigma factor [Tepidisphaeraceae bacterium]